jgi:hypothetical protein
MTRLLAIALLLGAGTVGAQVDPKKTEQGAGELFRGMGQEIQKSGILGGKKDEPKKSAAKKDPAKKDAKTD